MSNKPPSQSSAAPEAQQAGTVKKQLEALRKAERAKKEAEAQKDALAAAEAANRKKRKPISMPKAQKDALAAAEAASEKPAPQPEAPAPATPDKTKRRSRRSSAATDKIADQHSQEVREFLNSIKNSPVEAEVNQDPIAPATPTSEAAISTLSPKLDSLAVSPSKPALQNEEIMKSANAPTTESILTPQSELNPVAIESPITMSASEIAPEALKPQMPTQTSPSLRTKARRHDRATSAELDAPSVAPTAPETTAVQPAPAVETSVPIEPAAPVTNVESEAVTPSAQTLRTNASRHDRATKADMVETIAQTMPGLEAQAPIEPVIPTTPAVETPVDHTKLAALEQASTVVSELKASPPPPAVAPQVVEPESIAPKPIVPAPESEAHPSIDNLGEWKANKLKGQQPAPSPSKAGVSQGTEPLELNMEVSAGENHEFATVVPAKEDPSRAQTSVKVEEHAHTVVPTSADIQNVLQEGVDKVKASPTPAAIGKPVIPPPPSTPPPPLAKEAAAPSTPPPSVEETVSRWKQEGKDASDGKKPLSEEAKKGLEAVATHEARSIKDQPIVPPSPTAPVQTPSKSHQGGSSAHSQDSFSLTQASGSSPAHTQASRTPEPAAAEEPSSQKGRKEANDGKEDDDDKKRFGFKDAALAVATSETLALSLALIVGVLAFPASIPAALAVYGAVKITQSVIKAASQVEGKDKKRENNSPRASSNTKEPSKEKGVGKEKELEHNSDEPDQDKQKGKGSTTKDMILGAGIALMVVGVAFPPLAIIGAGMVTGVAAVKAAPEIVKGAKFARKGADKVMLKLFGKKTPKAIGEEQELEHTKGQTQEHQVAAGVEAPARSLAQAVDAPAAPVVDNKKQAMNQVMAAALGAPSSAEHTTQSATTAMATPSAPAVRPTHPEVSQARAARNRLSVQGQRTVAATQSKARVSSAPRTMSPSSALSNAIGIIADTAITGAMMGR